MMTDADLAKRRKEVKPWKMNMTRITAPVPEYAMMGRLYVIGVRLW